MRRLPSGGTGALPARLGADNIARQALSESPDEHRRDSVHERDTFREREGAGGDGDVSGPRETASEIEDGAQEGEGMVSRLDRMENGQKRIEDLLIQLTKELQDQRKET